MSQRRSSTDLPLMLLCVRLSWRSSCDQGQFGYGLPAAGRGPVGHEPDPADMRLDGQPTQHVRLCSQQFRHLPGRPVTDREMRDDIVLAAP